MTEQEISNLQSSANAWNSLHKRLEELRKSSFAYQKVSDEVTGELFRNGCHSAWVHLFSTVERMVEMIEDLQGEVEYLDSRLREES